MRSALVIVTCLIAAACSATGPDLRPRASGFTTGAGVVDPYEDGKRHLAAGRYQLAAERFGQALAEDRRSLDALNGLAIAHTRLGRFDVAQTYFERALQIDATSAVTLNNYGWSLVEQSRLRDAKPFLELALHRAAEADVPIVAANIEGLGQARPPALIAALEKGSPPRRLPASDSFAWPPTAIASKPIPGRATRLSRRPLLMMRQYRQSLLGEIRQRWSLPRKSAAAQKRLSVHSPSQKGIACPASQRLRPSSRLLLNRISTCRSAGSSTMRPAQAGRSRSRRPRLPRCCQEGNHERLCPAAGAEFDQRGRGRTQAAVRPHPQAHAYRGVVDGINVGRPGAASGGARE